MAEGYSALKQYDAQYRDLEFELAHIEDQKKAVKADLQEDEKEMDEMQREIVHLRNQIDTFRARRMVVAEKIENVRKDKKKAEEEVIELVKEREKQRNMRIAMEEAHKKRMEVMDRAYNEHLAAYMAIPVIAKLLQERQRLAELQQAIEEKKAECTTLATAIQERKEREDYTWKEFTGICIQAAKNWKRASEESKKREETKKKEKMRMQLTQDVFKSTILPKGLPKSGMVESKYTSQTLKDKNELAHGQEFNTYCATLPGLFEFSKRPKYSNRSSISSLMPELNDEHFDMSKLWNQLSAGASQIPSSRSVARTGSPGLSSLGSPSSLFSVKNMNFRTPKPVEKVSDLALTNAKPAKPEPHRPGTSVDIEISIRQEPPKETSKIRAHPPEQHEQAFGAGESGFNGNESFNEEPNFQNTQDEVAPVSQKYDDGEANIEMDESMLIKDRMYSGNDYEENSENVGAYGGYEEGNEGFVDEGNYFGREGDDMNSSGFGFPGTYTSEDADGAFFGEYPSQNEDGDMPFKNPFA